MTLVSPELRVLLDAATEAVMRRGGESAFARQQLRRAEYLLETGRPDLVFDEGLFAWLQRQVKTIHPDARTLRGGR